MIYKNTAAQTAKSNPHTTTNGIKGKNAVVINFALLYTESAGNLPVEVKEKLQTEIIKEFSNTYSFVSVDFTVVNFYADGCYYSFDLEFSKKVVEDENLKKYRVIVLEGVRYNVYTVNSLGYANKTPDINGILGIWRTDCMSFIQHITI